MIKVTVLCLTYNHSKYIRQTLEGFIMQKTDFDFEVLVNDDASTDGTAEIVKEYAEKYPDIIKPNFQTENLYSQGVRGMVVRFLLPRAKGKYVALCEGDDYWTSPDKLQLQVDFMESHPDYSICFHPVEVIYENNEEPSYVYPETKDVKKFTVEALLQENFIQTNSVMYRRQEYRDMPTDIMPGDWYLHLYHAQFGKIGFVDKVMSVYRKHPGGIWWGDKVWLNHGITHLRFFVELLSIYGTNKNYTDIIFGQILDMFTRLIETDRKFGTDLLSQAIKEFPDNARDFLLQQQREIDARANALVQEKENKARLEHEARDQAILLEDKVKEIAAMKASPFRTFIKSMAVLALPPDTWRRQVAREMYLWARSERPLSQLPTITRRIAISLSDGVANYTADKVDFIRSSYQYRRLNRELSAVEREDSSTIAIVVHLYYLDLWPELLVKIHNLAGFHYDLFITIPTSASSFVDDIRKDCPAANIFTVPNRGRDVLPFIFINTHLSKMGYKYLLKVHSKKSIHRKDGDTWRDEIVSSLLPANKERMNEIISTLEADNTGIIGPAKQYVSLLVNYTPNQDNITTSLDRVTSLSNRREIVDNCKDYGFFAGTMFWARVDCLTEFNLTNFPAGIFGREKRQIDRTLAHALERVFCLLSELKGKDIYEAGSSGVKKITYKTDNIPEWSDLYGKKVW